MAERQFFWCVLYGSTGTQEHPKMTERIHLYLLSNGLMRIPLPWQSEWFSTKFFTKFSTEFFRTLLLKKPFTGQEHPLIPASRVLPQTYWFRIQVKQDPQLSPTYIKVWVAITALRTVFFGLQEFIPSHSFIKSEKHVRSFKHPLTNTYPWSWIFRIM